MSLRSMYEWTMFDGARENDKSYQILRPILDKTNHDQAMRLKDSLL